MNIWLYMIWECEETAEEECEETAEEHAIELEEMILG